MNWTAVASIYRFEMARFFRTTVRRFTHRASVRDAYVFGADLL